MYKIPDDAVRTILPKYSIRKVMQRYNIEVKFLKQNTDQSTAHQLTQHVISSSLLYKVIILVRQDDLVLFRFIARKKTV